VIEDFLPCVILLPSLGRPHRLDASATNIHHNTDLDHSILWCVGGIQSKAVLDGLGEVYIDDTDDPDKRYVTRMNKLIHHPVVRNARTVFFGSDDVVHHDGWLREALTQMEAQRKAVVVVNDMHNPNGTQAIVRTDYFPLLCFDDPTVAFHPGYDHNYADTEQFATAMRYGQHGRAMESVVEHLHPIFQTNTSRPWDDTYRNAFKHWQEDSVIFHERMQALDREDEAIVTSKKEAIARLWPGE
jgi:hypothetical protein